MITGRIRGSCSIGVSVVVKKSNRLISKCGPDYVKNSFIAVRCLHAFSTSVWDIHSAARRDQASRRQSSLPSTLPSSDPLDPIYLQLKENELKAAAQSLFQRCQENKDGGFNPQTSSSNNDLNDVLIYLQKSPHQTETFLKLLHEVAAEGGNADCGPTQEHFMQVLQGWFEFQPPSAKRAQALLDDMDQDLGIDYHIDTCNLVLRTWARVKNAEGAQALLDNMMYEKQDGAQPNTESFQHVLEAWSKSKSPLSTQNAEFLLSEMKRRKVQANAECLLWAIACCAKSRRRGSENRIEELYQQVWRKFEKDTSIDPKVVQMGMLNVVQAYHKISNAHMAEELLLEFAEQYRQTKLVPPTLQMCISVLATWSKSKSSRRASRAEKLLSLMEKDDMLPRPDVACYTTVLHCWAGSGKPNAASRAELLLRLMECNDDTPPNILSYTCVLNAWSRSDDEDAPIQAERILSEMKEQGIKLDRLVYATMITSWGRSSREGAVEMAEGYFNRLKDIQLAMPNETLKVTVVEYTATIQAWTNHVSRHLEDSRQAVDRALALLDDMHASEDPDARPNSLTYAAVLRTIVAARRIPDRRDRATSVLRRMESQQMEITPYIQSLIKQCSSR